MAALAVIVAAFALPSGALADDFTNDLGMVFVPIAPGSFVMGTDTGGDSDEGPSHQVAITKPFYLGKHEVTQSQWLALMEDNPSQFQDPNSPVDSVSWDDAQEFVRRLNEKEGTKAYRLPTEAEWEFAARGGTQGDYFFGDPSLLDHYAWYANNSGNSTHPVGGKEPNPFGLHDILGNVYEWASDHYGKDYYSQSPAADPGGPSESLDQYRSLRGGCFNCSAFFLRSSFRSFYGEDVSMDSIGFRVAMDPRTQE
ncbi:MAG: formylglycine-generating enzyme family protein [Deltaproteobacteria bacterium]|nr:formylglycine-generating enzyme family protein [Deltaproteobacteria bacterium]